MFKNMKLAMQYLSSLDKLVEQVKALDGKVHYSAANTCVTVSLPDGSFIATADFGSRIDNVELCLTWLGTRR